MIARIPPFNVILAAVTVPGTAPRFKSADTLKVPAFIVLIPV